MNVIFQRPKFDVASIMYFSIMICMEQAHECIQHPGMAMSLLVLLSLIMKICINNGADLSSIDIFTPSMGPFTNTTIRSSMSALSEHL